MLWNLNHDSWCSIKVPKTFPHVCIRRLRPGVHLLQCGSMQIMPSNRADEGCRCTANQINSCLLFTIRSCYWSIMTIALANLTSLPKPFHMYGWLLWGIYVMHVSLDHMWLVSPTIVKSGLWVYSKKTNPCLFVLRICCLSTLIMTVDAYKGSQILISCMNDYFEDWGAFFTWDPIQTMPSTVLKGFRRAPNQTNSWIFTLRCCCCSTLKIRVDASTRL